MSVVKTILVSVLSSCVAGGHAFITPRSPSLHETAQPIGKLTESTATRMSARSDFGSTVASWGLASALLFGMPLLPPPNAAAISGGGLDYSGLNLTGQDFSKGKYRSKDFSGAIAKEVNFKGSDLRGVRFFKADLKKADFTDANLETASLEEADLDGTILKNAVVTGTYFSSNVENVGDITGADFTDALLRKDVTKALCKRPDATGTNPTTGVDTRDSLLCDMF